MIMTFIPLERTDVPVLSVRTDPDNPNFIFSCTDVSTGRVEVETQHALLSDALRQVALRMDVDCKWARRNIEYRVEL